MVRWTPARPRVHPLRLVLSLLVGAVAVWVSAAILPGVHVKSFGGALIAAVLVGAFNAVLPPMVAALRLPFMLAIGFLVVLAADAASLLLGPPLFRDDFSVDSFGARCWPRW